MKGRASPQPASQVFAPTFSGLSCGQLVTMLHAPGLVGGLGATNAIAARLVKEVDRMLSRCAVRRDRRDDTVEAARDQIYVAIVDPDSKYHEGMRLDFETTVKSRFDVARRAVARRHGRFIGNLGDDGLEHEPVDERSLADPSKSLDLARRVARVRDEGDREVVLLMLEGCTIGEIAMLTDRSRTLIKTVIADFRRT